MARCYTLGVLFICCSIGSSVFAQSPPPGYGSVQLAPPMSGGLGDGIYGTEDCPPGMEGYGDPNAIPARPAFSFAGWFVRAEYLNWNFSKPGDVLLGSEVLGVPDPRQPRPIFDQSTNPPTFLGNASIPALDSIRLAGANGVRTTLGVPLTFGAYETNVFGFSRKSGVVTRTDLVGTSTLVNGNLGDNVNLYNNGYFASYASRLWGSEHNLILDGAASNFFSLSPIVGFRYLNVTEQLDQRGSFQPNPITGLPIINTDIFSHSMNNVFAGQMGFRFALDTKYVTLQFDPKVALGGNILRNRVSTNHFRSNSDPFVQTIDSQTHFAQVIDLPFTGRFHVSPNLSLVGGYEFLWVNGITRPHKSIEYNDNGPFPTPPGVVVHTTFQQMIFMGMTLGMELKF